MARKNDSQQFENALAELEEIVSNMEQGDLSLEDSLAAFEQGVKLTKECQKSLKSVEQKVNKLIAKDKKLEIEPFDPEK
ncbi:MAG: exodeoxyribonuclease VII small subunit [Gammaproteobacteria bacterium]|nr:exodeoxyribonuclease VII small subunit [Gammaproteobacteria bacterium]